jgi:glycosyltransferase involved in cell wall biosynthesis
MKRDARVAYLGNSRSPHNIRWAQELSRHFDVVVYSFEPDPVPGVATKQLPGLTGKKLDYALRRRRAARIIAEQQPDLIHAHRISSYGLVGAYAADHIRGADHDAVPFLLSVWGEDVFSFPRKSPFHRALTRRVLASATQILSTSEVMARETEHYVNPARPIRVTPFGVDTARFTPEARSMGLASGEPAEGEHETGGNVAEVVTIGTVKKLRARYGIDILIRAFARAREELGGEPETQLLIVGEGPDHERLEALAEQLGLGEHVRFAGRVPHEEVPQVLAGLDIFAALSITDDESFGVAMLEASASGLPVVATRVGGVPEVVQDGTTGYLVAPQDVEAAASRLVELARDPQRRHRMGSAGRGFAEEHYSWGAAVALMRDIYEELITTR